MRGTTILMTGALMLAPAIALAQTTPDQQPKTPPSTAVGPTELQNFSLSGTPNKPSDQPAATTSSPQAPAQTAPQPAPTAVATAPERRKPAERTVVKEANAPLAVTPKAAAPTTVAATTPPPAATPTLTPTVTQQPTFSAASLPTSPPTALAPERNFSSVTWLLAGLALVAGILFLLWRRRTPAALAGVPHAHAFVPPEPVAPPQPLATPRSMAPRPAPQPPTAPQTKPAPSATVGIVSTRLRPTLEISVQPLRCVVDDQQIAIDFELELFNAGAAPARDVFAEARLLSAGAQQDQELAAFFTDPVVQGEPVDGIPPMKRMTFTTQVVAPRAALHEYDLGGGKALVPVLAFNSLYRWSGGEAQSSAAFLIGRNTKSEKLGPFGLNGSPREFRALAARALPAGVRT